MPILNDYKFYYVGLRAAVPPVELPDVLDI